jgi:MYXO-CTERM domain-containing protein
MAGYDPKRARPATDAPADEPAQVDALLGDVPPAEQVDEPERLTEPAPAPAATPRPVLEVPPVPDAPSSRVLVIAGVATAAVALFVLLRRRRR